MAYTRHSFHKFFKVLLLSLYFTKKKEKKERKKEKKERKKERKKESDWCSSLLSISAASSQLYCRLFSLSISVNIHGLDLQVKKWVDAKRNHNREILLVSTCVCLLFDAEKIVYSGPLELFAENSCPLRLKRMLSLSHALPCEYNDFFFSSAMNKPDRWAAGVKCQSDKARAPVSLRIAAARGRLSERAALIGARGSQRERLALLLSLLLLRFTSARAPPGQRARLRLGLGINRSSRGGGMDATIYQIIFGELGDLNCSLIDAFQDTFLENASLSLLSSDGLYYCNATTDEIGTCWPRSSTGRIVERPCPEYINGVKYNTTSRKRLMLSGNEYRKHEERKNYFYLPFEKDTLALHITTPLYMRHSQLHNRSKQQPTTAGAPVTPEKPAAAVVDQLSAEFAKQRTSLKEDVSTLIQNAIKPIQDSPDSLQTTVTSFKKRLASFESVADDNFERLTVVESTINTLQSQNQSLPDWCDDIETFTEFTEI
ncbi:hypothetical protein L3Q82_006140 [Scortum barcoo]|uniref:Uncharacterized protein n=1 Tax=Scortum barcoo TaxID=214431 RepID=A0ACB8X208_9TELE|nr:hypothetical protein L3Q82_006140 [Scortum barcoo]